MNFLNKLKLFFSARMHLIKIKL